MKVAQKVMPSVLLCWPMTSEADVAVMAVEAQPSHQHSITCCCHATDGSRGTVWQNGIRCGSADEAKVSDWVPPCGKKMAPVDVHWCLLNICGDQRVDVSTLRWWVVHFSSHDSNMKDKPHSRQPCRFLQARYDCSCSSLVKVHS